MAAGQLADLPPQAQLASAELMDAVVIVDPAQYQRRPGELERPLPSAQVGLVTFLVYAPGDLVLVTRVVWPG